MQLHHLALGTDDPDALAAFYETQLGCRVIARHGTRSVWLDLGGVTLMIERRDQAPRARTESGVNDGLFLFALRTTVTERKTLEHRLTAAGVRKLGETDFTTYFADPDGNRFALSHYPDR